MIVVYIILVICTYINVYVYTTIIALANTCSRTMKVCIKHHLIESIESLSILVHH